MARAIAATTLRRMWGLVLVACLPIMTGCEEQTESASPTVGVELRMMPTIHPDTVLEVTPERRTVTVDAERWTAATAIALTIEAELTMSVIRVDGVEVMRPEGPLRIERWSAKGNGRPLLLELPRCDSVQMTVTEEVTSAGQWIRHSSELLQNRALPSCCEATLRRRRASR
ncbi:MAG: hypothetical protein F4Y07_12590 [Gemmatimonadetes bacterium]|nr:hypothetical protein [Gemmatimonadota bacterium]